MLYILISILQHFSVISDSINSDIPVTFPYSMKKLNFKGIGNYEIFK